MQQKIINWFRERLDILGYMFILILLVILVCEHNYQRGYYSGFNYYNQLVNKYGWKEEKSAPTVTPTPTITPTATPTPKPTPVETEDFFIDTPIDKVYDEEELRYLSSIIQCEAGNQCKAGQQAVGIVVMNRKNHEIYFADTVREVIYQPGQFTPAHNGFLDRALAAYDAGTLSQDVIDAAKYALDGNIFVSYNGEKIDMTPYLYFNGRLSNAKIRIQDHDFA